MEKRTTLKNFDNLEILTVQGQANDIPEHFHETFCISLIRSGIEAIHMYEDSLFSPAGNITITNPFEVHANPLLDKDANISYDTIYLSQDLVDFYLNKENVFFENRQFNQNHLITSFIKLQNAISAKGNETEKCLLNFLQLLEDRNVANERNTSMFSSSIWPEIIHFIEHNISKKMTLEILASYSNTDKFNFAKKFRAKFGISPMNYILMKKIFTAKNLITKDCNLTALAYQFHFSDQAHFSKTFKRFIGISPNQYKKSLH